MKKILIALLLISINANARIKIDILNGEGQPMVNEFNTQEEADAYILKAVKRGDWGKASWVETDCGNSFETRTNPLTSITEYLCPQNFTVGTSDITTQHTKKVAKDQIKKDMEFGRDLYAEIRLINTGKSKAVRDGMRSSFRAIREALFDGDICSAKTDIAGINPNANISQASIDFILGKINSYKTCE